MINYQSFTKGLSVVPKVTTENDTKGDIELLTSDNKLRFYNGTVNDPMVTETVSATLTNKTIAAGSNTITGLTNTNLSGTAGISNANLANSSITINGSPVSLGGSITITASTTSTLTIGTGLTGTSFNGSAPVTITIDSTVATLTGSQVLTNKTLTSPILNTATADTIAAISGGNLVLNAGGTDTVVIQKTGSVVASFPAAGILLGTARNVTFANNSQTVTLNMSGSASASYTVTWPAAAPTANTALVYTGSSTYAWATAGGWTVGTSTSLAAGGTVTISTTAGQQVFSVASSGGAVTLASAPFGSTDPVDGAVVRLLGTSSTNTVQISDSDTANGCRVNGNAILGAGCMIEFQYINSADRWYETFRNF